MEFCKSCKKEVIVFKQEYTTMPQNTDNQVRRYRETFCALCGRLTRPRAEIDEVVK